MGKNSEENFVEIELQVVPDNFDFDSIDPSDKTLYLRESIYNRVQQVADETGKSFDKVLESFIEYSILKAEKK